MNIKFKNSYSTVELKTLNPGDVFVLSDMDKNPDEFYIVIEPDYELDETVGVYCVLLNNGELYRFLSYEDVIPVKLETTASF